MAHITNLPTEILLEVEKYLDYPFSKEAIALASTCKSLWERTGGDSLYYRAAVKDRDRIREAVIDEIARIKSALLEIEEGEIIEVEYDHIGVEAVATGIAGTADIVELPEHSPNSDYPEAWPTFDQATRFCLNLAIRRCGDLAKLEMIIGIYNDIIPGVFRGQWNRLGELTPIHTAIRARRLDVVQLLVKKGLAPECNDTVLGRPLLVWGTPGEVQIWCNPQEGMKQAVRFDSTLFNVALEARAEDICLFLLDNSYGVRFDRQSSLQPDKLELYLAFAEEYEMYRLIDALLNYLETALIHLDYPATLRRLLVRTTSDGCRNLPVLLLPEGNLVPHIGFSGSAPAGSLRVPPRAHILDRVLDKTVGNMQLAYRVDLDLGSALDFPLKYNVERSCAWSASRILRHQVANGMVDGEDVLKTLKRKKCLFYDNLDLFRFVWPDNQHLLYQSDCSEEENARAAALCWSICLGHSMAKEARPEAPDSAYSQLKTAVRPGLHHLCCAIVTNQLAIVDELILDHGLDPHQELSTVDDDLYFDDTSFGKVHYDHQYTAFGVAIDSWWWSYDHRPPPLSAMTMVCRLVYHCGAPKSWSVNMREGLQDMWDRYFSLDDGRWFYSYHGEDLVGVGGVGRKALLFSPQDEDDEKIRIGLWLLFHELRGAVEDEGPERQRV